MSEVTREVTARAQRVRGLPGSPAVGGQLDLTGEIGAAAVRLRRPVDDDAIGGGGEAEVAPPLAAVDGR